MTKTTIQRHDLAIWPIWYEVVFDTCGLRDTISGSMATQQDILFIAALTNTFLMP